MDAHEGSEAAGGEERPPSPAVRAVILGGFGLSCVVNLLLGRWVTAAFFAASALFSLKGREIEGWPRPRRYAAVAAYLALGAAMLFEAYRQVGPSLWR
ncbi:MAG TPA: hypothetical protein VF668_10985 [Pyrinomonadaceae bacterium]|jgi:hypothetical protein